MSVTSDNGERFVETIREGSLAGLEESVGQAERAALANGGFGEGQVAGVSVAAVTLGVADGRRHGVIVVVRRGRPFTDDDREVLRSLGAEAALALENIELHFQGVARR